MASDVSRVRFIGNRRPCGGFLKSYNEPMPGAASQHEVKRIGETGQVSVGKSLAGKLVRVERRPEGVLLRFVEAVPEQDMWWLKEPHKSKLKRALEWAATHPAAETDLDELLAKAKKHAAKRATAKKAGARKATQKQAPAKG